MRNIRSLYSIILSLFFSVITMQGCSDDKPVVRIGIIHSLSGTMAFSEKPLVDMLTFAIEEANKNGGVLGRKIVPIIVDGRSDWRFFAKEAERLIVEEHVSALFACWTSACRKAIKPVVEKHRHLLFYPLQYEGLEQSPDIVYTGATPNQQIIPSIIWALKNIGKRFFLIGSDSVFPRTAHLIIKDLLKTQHAEVLAEHYLPLGSKEVTHVIDEIERLKPDVILNTISGDSNLAFFTALKTINNTSPVISYSIAEPEFAQMEVELVARHYAAWNYFQSIETAKNKRFVKKFKQRFGENSLINDPMEASYIGFQLWMNAVEHARSTEPLLVKAVIGTESFNAPEGIVAVDSISQHLWKTTRIGLAKENGRFDIVWQSDRPIKPVPYPSYRSKKEWKKLAKKLSGNGPAQ